MNVGDTVLFVPNSLVRSGLPQDVTITKVGRKWLHLSNGMRCDRVAMKVDGGIYSSPGKCWPSRAEYEAAIELRTVWLQFKKAVDNGVYPPPGVTLSNIYKAAFLLMIPLPQPTPKSITEA